MRLYAGFYFSSFYGGRNIHEFAGKEENRNQNNPNVPFLKSFYSSRPKCSKFAIYEEFPIEAFLKCSNCAPFRNFIEHKTSQNVNSIALISRESQIIAIF
jgi:hypothetical protein